MHVTITVITVRLQRNYDYIALRYVAFILSPTVARESFFGNDLLHQCTAMGTIEFPALPQDQLLEMKQFVEGIVPTVSLPVFEDIWQKCVEKNQSSL